MPVSGVCPLSLSESLYLNFLCSCLNFFTSISLILYLSALSMFIHLCVSIEICSYLYFPICSFIALFFPVVSLYFLFVSLSLCLYLPLSLFLYSFISLYLFNSPAPSFFISGCMSLSLSLFFFMFFFLLFFVFFSTSPFLPREPLSQKNEYINFFSAFSNSAFASFLACSPAVVVICQQIHLHMTENQCPRHLWQKLTPTNKHA